MASRPVPAVVVVTGASAGVGRATVRAFARAGASVGLIARNEEALEAAKREVEALGQRARVYVADVADDRAIDAAASHFERELGPIGCWVNNAMASVFSPILEMTPEEYRRVTDVTYLGYVYGTMAALKRMVPRDEGVIVQVGSALAYRAIPLQSAYCAAKHAVQGFTESLRSELIHDGSRVHVTMVQLPAVNTPQFGWVRSKLPRKAQPVPPIYQPELAADSVLWSATHDRREVAVGWPSWRAIFANYFVPGYIDRRLAHDGYSGQMTDEPEDPGRPDNLCGPVPGDHGAHGRFDARASDFDPLWWANKHRLALSFGALGAAAAGVLGAAGFKARGARDRAEG